MFNLLQQSKLKMHQIKSMYMNNSILLKIIRTWWLTLKNNNNHATFKVTYIPFLSV